MADRTNPVTPDWSSMFTINQKINQIFGHGECKNNKEESCDDILKSMLKINGNDSQDLASSRKKNRKVNNNYPEPNLDGEKKKRKRTIKLGNSSDDKNTKKRNPKNISEVELIKSIIRGEDVLSDIKPIDDITTSWNQKYSDGTPSTTDQLFTAVNEYVKNLQNTEPEIKAEPNDEGYVSEMNKDNTLKSNIENENIIENYPNSTFSQNQFFQNQNITSGQQSFFDNTSANISDPQTHDAEQENMTSQQMSNMLIYQQNMIAYYQKLLFSGQVYPWQSDNSITGEAGNPFFIFIWFYYTSFLVSV